MRMNIEFTALQCETLYMNIINLYSSSAICIQVKLKTRMVIEEYRSELYNRKFEFLVKWSVLSDSL